MYQGFLQFRFYTFQKFWILEDSFFNVIFFLVFMLPLNAFANFACIVFMCALKLCLYPNEISQCWHENGLIFRCTEFTWALQLFFSLNDFSQCWHEKRFIWKCTVSICFFMLLFWLNDLSQWGQEKDLVFKCFIFTWISKAWNICKIFSLVPSKNPFDWDKLT